MASFLLSSRPDNISSGTEIRGFCFAWNCWVLLCYTTDRLPSWSTTVTLPEDPCIWINQVFERQDELG